MAKEAPLNDLPTRRSAGTSGPFSATVRPLRVNRRRSGSWEGSTCEELGRAHRLLMRSVREPRGASRRSSGRCRRVLVVDDHPLTRAGVTALLNQQPGVRVCRQVGSVVAALAAVRRSPPDLVLTDLEMGPRSGMELVRRLHAERPWMPVIVFSMHYGSIYAERALRAGASGYVMKSEGPARLLEAVRQALAAAAAPVASRRPAAPCARRRRSPRSSIS